ncbi:hypothetical protein RQM47_04890 [Rubrivirga sp. S365]|uniref:SRP54-type proteins GTP-binding domain-containing protein n=1 Tax=Rubrivirga litoralis TaxID=3075598 RepID=A0ABU3BQ20_9BACT|nr:MULTISPECIES: hypothetical protein [unclassified Rubrivirga]MDT0631378.1 hypothetical protein [Rubrivirga sp. F394]MDT7855969.1 hypothetical protein [Rubrivirga sp. S365]
MQIKTIPGSSIQTALAEARATLGDGVVLLESVAAADGRPAQITVALDAAPAAPRPVAAGGADTLADDAGGAGTRPALAGGAGEPLGFGYAAARAPARTAAPRPLFTAPPAVAPPPRPPGAAPAPEVLDRLERLDARLAGLGELAGRLDRLEHRLGNALLGGSQTWAAHPLYGRLLRSGLAPATATDLLNGAVEGSPDPDHLGMDDHQTLLWSVAQTLRDRLRPTTPRRYAADTLVAIGPGGAGKTSFLKRLATDPQFYGRREVGVLTVVPEGTSGDPGAEFRALGIRTRAARTADEVREALEQFHETDALLVDTPALPADDAAARRALHGLAEVLAPLTAFDVVLALDAARARPPLDLSRLDTLPLQPTLGVLTRLDEAGDWGRLAEWLLAFGRPVGFATTGPRLDESLISYSPTWFAERYAHRLHA